MTRHATWRQAEHADYYRVDQSGNEGFHGDDIIRNDALNDVFKR